MKTNRHVTGSSIALLLKKMRGIRLRLVVLSLFWILAGPACKFDRTGTGNAAPPPPTVTVSSSDLSQVIERETATARVEAIEAVEVRPRVSGHITEVHFAAGEIVHKGDVLYRNSPATFNALV
jgi:multidrug efflux pump subunit AcrA (membrane-fusion protein)